jgi:hypothetical protein
VITNAYAIRFCDERLRVVADQMATTYYSCKKLVQEYYANPELGTAFTDGIAEVVDDGATADGRPVITGNEALGIVTQAAAYVDLMEANGNSVLNVVLAMAVNGQAKF